MKLLRVGFEHPLLLLFLPLGLMSRGQRSDLHMHPLHALRALQQSVDSCVLSTSYLVLASVLTCLILIRHLHKASGKQPSTKAAFHNSEQWLLSYFGKLDVRENIHFSLLPHLPCLAFSASLSVVLGREPRASTHTTHCTPELCSQCQTLRNKRTLKQGNW